MFQTFQVVFLCSGTELRFQHRVAIGMVLPQDGSLSRAMRHLLHRGQLVANSVALIIFEHRRECLAASPRKCQHCPRMATAIVTTPWMYPQKAKLTVLVQPVCSSAECKFRARQRYLGFHGMGTQVYTPLDPVLVLRTLCPRPPCAFCGQPRHYKICAGCKAVTYCNKVRLHLLQRSTTMAEGWLQAHQRADWKVHKQLCTWEMDLR